MPEAPEQPTKALERPQVIGEAVEGLSTAELDLSDAAACQALAERLSPETILIWAAAIKRQQGDTLETYARNLKITTREDLALAELLAEAPP